MKPVVCILDAGNVPQEFELEGGEHAQMEQWSGQSGDDFRLGRAVLKRAGRKYLQRSENHGSGRLVIRTLQNGRPYIESYAHLFCSIAHSHGWGIAAVAPGRIGVDVEKVRPQDGSLLDHLADPEEVELVGDLIHQQADALTVIWTIKESVMKGLGSGLDMNPRQVRISSRMQGRGVEVRVPGCGQETWLVRSLNFGDYYFSVAYEKECRQ